MSNQIKFFFGSLRLTHLTFKTNFYTVNSIKTAAFQWIVLCYTHVPLKTYCPNSYVQSTCLIKRTSDGKMYHGMILKPNEVDRSPTGMHMYSDLSVNAFKRPENISHMVKFTAQFLVCLSLVNYELDSFFLPKSTFQNAYVHVLKSVHTRRQSRSVVFVLVFVCAQYLICNDLIF